jgi:hypothetical protein
MATDLIQSALIRRPHRLARLPCATDLGNIQHDLGNIRHDLGNIQHDLGNIQHDVGNIQHD